MKVFQDKTLTLAAPINSWYEALPLGNGILGALLWGHDSTIKLSLDRGDLWDTRVNYPQGFNRKTLQTLVKSGNIESIRAIFDAVYNNPFPTKIPAGRIILGLTQSDNAERFSLRLKRAEGHVKTSLGQITAFCHPAIPVGMIRSTNPEVFISLTSPFAESDHHQVPNSVSSLRYAAPERMETDASVYLMQKYGEGLTYTIAVRSRVLASNLRDIAFTITTSAPGEDPLASADKLLEQALETGYDVLFQEHTEWWERFWKKSSVTLPAPDLQRMYDLVQYYYGSASRNGYPPLPLQGLWTADENTLPPWKGDYHNDLNTQMTYWAYPCANHLDEGLCFLEFLWERMPEFEVFTRNFYDAPGACIPGVMSMDGKPLGGWPQYSLSPTHSAWIAQLFYLHWRYSMDETFLSTRAYPFCEKIAAMLESLLVEDDHGMLTLPLSTSPELHDDTPAAWLPAISNYDLSLLRWLFESVSSMADYLRKPETHSRYQGLLKKLPPLAVSETTCDGGPGPGYLLVCPGAALEESHRHLSHLMAIYPLGLLSIRNPDDKAIIDESLRQIDKLGTGLWVGFSFTWMACLAARCGMPERALHMLELFLKGFVSANGFNLNGDFKKLGISSWNYKPFTLEANFAAAEAIHEMLLQSWDGTLRIFPSVPESWKEVAFENLRAQGAFLVSARLSGGNVRWFRIAAEQNSQLVLRSPFSTSQVNWQGPRGAIHGKNIVVSLKRGQTIEASL